MANYSQAEQSTAAAWKSWRKVAFGLLKSWEIRGEKGDPTKLRMGLFFSLFQSCMM